MVAPSKPHQPYASLHTETHGPRDQRPTSLQVVKDAGAQEKLRDKVIFITGTSGGIGAEAARALYETGAQLFLGARDLPRLDKVIDDIIANAEIRDAPRPQPIELHLDSLEGVCKAADELRARTDKLSVLITNAGVMLTPYGHTKDGFETQFGTNHLAHFYLFQLLKPLLLETAAKSGTTSRVITVSSAGHALSEVDLDDANFDSREYNPWQSYAQSKTANIWMANEIDRRYGTQNLHAVSLHPGAILTDLARHLTEEQQETLGFGSEAFTKMSKSVTQGAATTVWAAVSPHFEDHGGVYLSDVGEAKGGEGPPGGPTYAPHAYSPEKEAKLWALSNKLVGINEQ